MTEQEWTQEEVIAPPKRGVPGWLWFCGCGCLIIVLLGVLAITWGVKKVKESTDPEVQWPKLEQILPCDERPEDMELMWGSQLVMGFYMLIDEADGFVVILMQLPAANAEQELERVMDEDWSGSLMGMGGRRDMEAGTVEVQGRELRVLRARVVGGGGGGPPGVPKEASDASGPTIYIDLTKEGETRPVVVQMISVSTDEPITDEEVREFFEPFHVGPNR